MTEVEFHTGLADPVRFACRLLRKAVRQGARATVTAPAPTMAALDRELWTFDERDFVPHVRWRGDCPPHLLARTPLWLVEDLSEGLPPGASGLVVNVGAAMSPVPVETARLIELVGQDPADEAGARARWRAYKERGLRIVHHAAGATRER